MQFKSVILVSLDPRVPSDHWEGGEGCGLGWGNAINKRVDMGLGLWGGGGVETF